MKKSTVILLGILLFLAGVAFLLLQQPGEQSLTESGKERLFDVDSAAVREVTIESPSVTVNLTRTGDEWFIGRFRADQTAVGNLLRQAEELAVNSIISDKPEKQSLFQVDSSGTRMVFRIEDGDSAVCILGRTGPGMNDVYARREGSNEVVLVDAAISYASNRSVKDWRDRTITSIPREEIRHIGFEYGDTTFALVWNDSAWAIGSEPVKDWVANSLATSLSDFDADDFLETAPSPIPKLTATVSVAGIQIQFFKSKDSQKYAVKSSSTPQWYEIEEWRANQVLKRKRDLLTGS